MRGARTVEDAEALSDGRNVRWTLERMRQESPTPVRIDWLRFTVSLDAIVQADESLPVDTTALSVMSRDERDMHRRIRSVETHDYTGAMAVTASAVRKVSEILGVFEAGRPEDKGMDFYTARCAFMRNSAVVGYALAGGKSTAQASTVHFNLWGSAALHVSHEKWAALADWIDEVGGTITRVDLALDLFRGLDMEWCRGQWSAGAFDVRGKRPKETEIGSWEAGYSRTFQVGKRETGKVVRIYEKGDELFGEEANDPWVRVECEFRSNHRVIGTEVLTHPADFFAGACRFCAELAEAEAIAVEPARIRTLASVGAKLVAVTAYAHCARLWRWYVRTAAPSMAKLCEHGGHLIERAYDAAYWRMPRSLGSLSFEEMREGFGKVAAGLAPSVAPIGNGA